MSRRILAQYMPRANSQWGELAGSSLNLYRPYSYYTAKSASAPLVKYYDWRQYAVINLEAPIFLVEKF